MKENKGVFSNLCWRFAERCGAQMVSFIVSVALARVLDPNIYGTIALITVITAILQIFVDSGLGNALIQKKDADDLDFSTVFYTNVIFCCVLYGVIYWLAPMIANFYADTDMCLMIRILAVTVLISGVKNVQQAYVSRHMQFKKFFFSTLGGTIIAAIVGIGMALRGFGAWALVAQQLVNLFIDTVILWITVDWRPRLQFSIVRLKSLWKYGWKLLVSNLINTIYNNLRQLIIGRLYSSADLAYYNRGDQLPELIVRNINTSIDSVLLPVMSNEQDNRQRVKMMTRRAIKTSVYIMAPLMMGLGAVARPLISMLLTDKWLPCVPFVRISCVVYMFYPIHTANLNAIIAMGRSDLFLKLEILKKIIGLGLLIITMRMGVMAMAYSLLISTAMSQLINSAPNKHLLGYSYIEQLKDILPTILLAVVMALGVSSISLTGLPNIISLIMQIGGGAIIYIAGSAILKIESFEYFRKMIASQMINFFEKK